MNDKQAILFPTEAELQSPGVKALREWAGRSFKGIESQAKKNTEPGICEVCERPFQPAANNWKKQMICGDRDCRLEYSRRYQRNKKHNVIALPNRGGVLLVEPVTHPVRCASTPLDRGDQQPPVPPIMKGDLKLWLRNRDVAVMVVEMIAATEHMPVEEIEDLLSQLVGEIKQHRGRTNGMG